MRKTLEDFYFGGITPCDQQMTPDSEMKRAVDLVSQCEEQLTERLDGEGRRILTKLTCSQQEIDSKTALENFVLGFRLGARLMAECMDSGDGDFRNGGG